MHLTDALFYVNYVYTHPYVLAATAASIFVGVLTLAWCMTSMFSISDIVPLTLICSLAFYMWD